MAEADLTDLLRDEEYREEMAKQSYLRERLEDAAVDAEQRVEADDAYLTLAWESISDSARRPYRTAVATVCDEIAQVAAAIA